jgi:hypothetical protein
MLVRPTVAQPATRLRTHDAMQHPSCESEHLITASHTVALTLLTMFFLVLPSLSLRAHELRGGLGRFEAVRMPQPTSSDRRSQRMASKARRASQQCHRWAKKPSHRLESYPTTVTVKRISVQYKFTVMCRNHLMTVEFTSPRPDELAYNFLSQKKLYDAGRFGQPHSIDGDY